MVSFIKFSLKLLYMMFGPSLPVEKLILRCFFHDRILISNSSCWNPWYLLISIIAYIQFALLYPPNNEVVGGVYWFQSVRLSVRLSVCPSVRLSRLPCPLCNIYSSGWILSILATNDHYYEGMCRTQWPLTLTYIFKVIWPWLRKSCPLCNVYSSGWILFIYGTNDH